MGDWHLYIISYKKGDYNIIVNYYIMPYIHEYSHACNDCSCSCQQLDGCQLVVV